MNLHRDEKKERKEQRQKYINQRNEKIATKWLLVFFYSSYKYRYVNLLISG